MRPWTRLPSALASERGKGGAGTANAGLAMARAAAASRHGFERLDIGLSSVRQWKALKSDKA